MPIEPTRQPTDREQKLIIELANDIAEIMRARKISPEVGLTAGLRFVSASVASMIIAHGKDHEEIMGATTYLLRQIMDQDLKHLKDYIAEKMVDLEADFRKQFGTDMPDDLRAALERTIADGE